MDSISLLVGGAAFLIWWFFIREDPELENFKQIREVKAALKEPESELLWKMRHSRGYTTLQIERGDIQIPPVPPPFDLTGRPFALFMHVSDVTSKGLVILRWKHVDYSGSIKCITAVNVPMSMANELREDQRVKIAGTVSSFIKEWKPVVHLTDVVLEGMRVDDCQIEIEL